MQAAPKSGHFNYYFLYYQSNFYNFFFVNAFTEERPIVSRQGKVEDSFKVQVSDTRMSIVARRL